MRTRPSPVLLGALAMASAASVPRSGTMIPITETATNANDDVRSATKARRESKRGAAPYRPKDGNAKVDIARRDRAEAKRQRKARRRAERGS